MDVGNVVGKLEDVEDLGSCRLGGDEREERWVS